jgi:hypothetical protein
MSCRMGCRVLPLRRVSLGTLSSFVAKYRACKRRRRPLENVLLRRRSSSSFTRAGREPMAASVAGSGQHAQRQISIMTVVSPASSRAEVKRRGRIRFRCLTRGRGTTSPTTPRGLASRLELQHLDAAGKAQTGHALSRVDTTLRPPIAIPPSA